MEELERLKKCALCKEKDANKKNTHYLTDAIIRSCFDIEGRSSNKYREMGIYYDVSSNTPLMRFGFQRSTPARILYDKLDRMPTDEENEEALNNPYSVDYVFCSDCENLFCEIEKPFVENVLPKIEEYGKKQLDLMEVSQIDEIRTIWLFFLLQYWRSCVCDPNISFNEEITEDLRRIILHHKEIEMDELVKYPLSLSYIKTSEPKNHTNHFVGFSTGRNPYIIVMNDFVVQLFDSKESIEYYSFFGINDEYNYKNYVNNNQNTLKIRFIQKEEWDAISLRYYEKEKLPKIEVLFVVICCILIRQAPSNNEIKDFRRFLGENTKSLFVSDTLLIKLMFFYIKQSHPVLFDLYNSPVRLGL